MIVQLVQTIAECLESMNDAKQRDFFEPDDFDMIVACERKKNCVFLSCNFLKFVKQTINDLTMGKKCLIDWSTKRIPVASVEKVYSLRLFVLLFLFP